MEDFTDFFYMNITLGETKILGEDMVFPFSKQALACS